MPLKTLILLTCAALIAACTDIDHPPANVSHGIGFTGIGSEPF